MTKLVTKLVTFSFANNIKSYMNLGKESETLEFKNTTGELREAIDDICAILNKHGKGVLYFGVKPNGDVCGQTVTASSLS